MKSKKILMALAGCLLASVMFAGSAHAGGWIGSGSIGGTGSGSGSGDGGCSGDNAMYLLECTGYSWMYFKYNGGYNGDITLPMNIDSSSVYISGECAEVGGFYHFGRNAQGRKYGGFTDYENVKGLGVESRSPYTYMTSAGSWGHMQTYTWGHATGISWAGYKTHSPVRQDIYKGNTIIYKGTSIVSEKKALADFKEAYLAVNGKEYTGSSFPNDLYAFCYGPDMGKKEATYTGKVTAKGDSGTVAKDTFTVTFTHSLKRTDNNFRYDPANHWYTEVDGGGTSGSGDHHAANAGWRDVRTDVVTGTITPGETLTICQTLYYKSSITETGSTDAHTQKCVTISRKDIQASGLVDAMVTTDTRSNVLNPGSAVSSNNGSYKVQFRHRVKRSRDGAGGSVSISWNTSVSGTSNRGGISDGVGTNRSGSVSVGSNSTRTVVDFPTETITGVLFPGESRTFCQTLTYTYQTRHTGYWTDSKGKKHRYYYYVDHSGSGSRCATVSRPNNLKCAIDGQSYGIDAGKNTARMKFMNASNGQNKTLVSSGNDHIWAKPTDRIRYEYDACASGQLHDDYYSWGGGSKSSYVFTGSNTTSSYPNRYLFPSDLGTGSQPYTALFGYGSTSFGGQSPYEKSFASPTVNTLGCGLSNPGQYYQIPALHNSSNCRSQEYIGRRSDAGSVISQTLVYTVKPGSGNNTLKGDVKVPYNYYLHVNPQSNNPKNVPVNADNSFNMTYKVDVKPRCNVQVQGNCNATSNEYQTYPKTTKYRIYSWLVDRNYSEAQLKSELGTEIRDHTTNELIGYLTSDPANNRNKFTINKSGDDLFGSEGLSVTISTDGSSKITVPHNAPIGSKMCVALAVWPADSHDVPNGAVINDGSQSVALTNRSNSSLWRSSKPNCYTVGKNPSISIKNGPLYAYNGVTASAFMRKPGGVAQEYLFGSWSEYNALSSRSTIIGLSSGAGLAGGTANFPADSNARVCRFSSMTLANADCSVGDVGKVTLSNSATTSPKNMLEQIMTRYTATVDSQGNAIEGLADGSEVDFKGMCKYDEKAGTYIPTNTADRGNYYCLNNGASYVSSSGTLKFTDDIPGGGRNGITRVWHIQHNGDQYGTRTHVVRAKKIIVNRDIRYGTNSYENTNDGHSKTIFQSLAEMPQVLLIADEIVIGESVRNLDAWLIADKINTCGISFDNKPLSTEEINSKVCNKQLHINGPVFTKNLYLNRTFGAGGDSQIARDTGGDQYWVTLSENGTGNFGTDKNVIAQPAEVFTISPEVYMWAYAEGTRFSQATTTYQRELPTRY